MASVHRGSKSFSAVIFDLDETLLARRGAWAYTLEEAVASLTGRRVDAAPLAADYVDRPWHQALGVLLDSRQEIADASRLCDEIYRRSAMKRMLVQEGIGMALDILRGASVEVGAVSREPHAVARRQVDSTGLDRFLAVLSATPERESWDALARAEECRSFLGWPAGRCAFISADESDLRAAGAAGFVPIGAAWAQRPCGAAGALGTPGDLSRLID